MAKKEGKRRKSWSELPVSQLKLKTTSEKKVSLTPCFKQNSFPLFKAQLKEKKDNTAKQNRAKCSFSSGFSLSAVVKQTCFFLEREA